MAREYPSVAEIRRLGEEVAEIAARIRGEVELRFAPAHEAGQLARDLEPGQSDRYAVGPDGRYLGTAADWARLHDGYAWIPEAFVQYVGPEPSGFDPLIEDMHSAWKALYDRDSGDEPVGTLIRIAEAHLSDWSGFTAVTFRANFLGRIPDAAKNQAQIAFMLEQAMIADQDVYVEARLDLAALAKNAKAALESVTKCGGADTAVTWLNVFAIVGAAAIVFLGPAGQIAATLAVSAVSAFALATSVAKDDPVKTDIAADTVDGVLNNLVYALSGVQRGIYDGERKIIKALRSNLDLMTDTQHYHGVLSTRDAFLPPRPALVGESMIPDIVRRDFVPS